MTSVLIIAGYLVLLLLLGLASNRFFRGTATDYFLASRGIGSFLLVMSLFGTTMTAFALIGSTGEAFKAGIGVYGLMASWSGIIHSACFFLVGIKLWSFGKKYGYVTQIQFFRDRFESDKLGLLLFPILVGLVIPYLLIGVLGAGTFIRQTTEGAFPEFFANSEGAVPANLGAAIICLVVLIYVFFGGVRGTAWANTFQTLVFLVLGLVAFIIIAGKLGGPVRATKMVQEHYPSKLKRSIDVKAEERYAAALAKWEADPQREEAKKPKPPFAISKLHFLTYMFIPLSVGMFPHLFQHWLTAKSAKSFRLSVIAHPLLIMVVWLPCVLLGVWATSAMVDGVLLVPPTANPNGVLGIMVNRLTGTWLTGLLAAGVLAAIMSSLDSQFLCVGSIFTNDIVGHYIRHEKLTDAHKVLLGRIFVVGIVVVTYLLSLGNPRSVFALGVWTFSGFAGLFPLVFAAVYWRRVTKAGAYACILTTAVTWFVLFWRADFRGGEEALFLGMTPVTTIIAASTAALVIVSLLTRPPSPETVAKFIPPRPSLGARANPAEAVAA